MDHICNSIVDDAVDSDDAVVADDVVFVVYDVDVAFLAADIVSSDDAADDDADDFITMQFKLGSCC